MCCLVSFFNYNDTILLYNDSKLRLQLGLKPLDVGGEKGGDEPTTDNKEDGSTNEGIYTAHRETG